MLLVNIQQYLFWAFWLHAKKGRWKRVTSHISTTKPPSRLPILHSSPSQLTSFSSPFPLLFFLMSSKKSHAADQDKEAHAVIAAVQEAQANNTSLASTTTTATPPSSQQLLRASDLSLSSDELIAVMDRVKHGNLSVDDAISEVQCQFSLPPTHAHAHTRMHTRTHSLCGLYVIQSQRKNVLSLSLCSVCLCLSYCICFWLSDPACFCLFLLFDSVRACSAFAG